MTVFQTLSVATVCQDPLSPAFSCHLQFGDIIIAYTSATNSMLDPVQVPQNYTSFTTSVEVACSDKKHLLLFIYRQGM